MKAKKANKIISLVVMIALVAGIVTPIAMVPVSAASSGEERVYNFENNFMGQRLDTAKFFGQILDDRFPQSIKYNVNNPLAGNSVADGNIQLDIVNTDSYPNRAPNGGGVGNYQSLKVQSPKGGSNFKIKPENTLPFVELDKGGDIASAFMVFYAKTDTPMDMVASMCVKDQVFSKTIRVDSKDWARYAVPIKDMRCAMPGHSFGDKDFLTITREGKADSSQGWGTQPAGQESFFCYFMFAAPASSNTITYFLDSLTLIGDGVKPFEGGLYGADRDNSDGTYNHDSDKPFGGTPNGETPNGGTPNGETPNGGTPNGGTPNGGTPNGGTPGTQTPDGVTTTPDGNLLLKDDVNNVSVEAAKGILPDGSTIAVKAITDGDSYTKAQTALKSMNPKSFVLYDIAVLKDGTAVTFNGKVKVTMPIPQGYDTDKLGVFSIGDDGKLTEMAVSIGEGTLSFETEHFSLYTIADLVGGSSTVAPTSSSEDTAKKGMSKTTLIIIIVAAAVVLLLGGGAAYYFLVMKKKDSVDTENTEIPENTVDAADTENKTDKTENK